MSELQRSSRDQAGDTHKIRLTLSGFKNLEQAQKFLHGLVKAEHIGFIQDTRDEGGAIVADITVCCFDMNQPTAWYGVCDHPVCIEAGKGCPA